MNHKADIHQYTWYQSTGGKKYVCTGAGWVQNAETGEWNPERIFLLELFTCQPQHIETDRMIKLLETGNLVVIKEPF